MRRGVRRPACAARLGSTAPVFTLADTRAVAQRAVHIVRQSGPRLLARKVLAELFYGRMVVYEACLHTPRAPIRSDLPLRFDVLGDLRVQDYVDCVPGTDREQFRQRLGIGDRCYAASLQGEVVAVRWAAFRDVRVTRLGLMLSLDEGDSYLYGAYTAPQWRRRGIGAALTAHLLDRLESEGYRRALSAWIPENAEARSLNPSRGEPVAVVSVVRMGPWRGGLPPRPASARGRFYRLGTSATGSPPSS